MLDFKLNGLNPVLASPTIPCQLLHIIHQTEGKKHLTLETLSRTDSFNVTKFSWPTFSLLQQHCSILFYPSIVLQLHGVKNLYILSTSTHPHNSPLHLPVYLSHYMKGHQQNCVFVENYSQRGECWNGSYVSCWHLQKQRGYWGLIQNVLDGFNPRPLRAHKDSKSSDMSTRGQTFNTCSFGVTSWKKSEKMATCLLID